MIIELVLGAGLVVAGITATRAMARRRAEEDPSDPSDKGPSDKGASGIGASDEDHPETSEADPAPVESGKKGRRRFRRARRKRPARVGPRGLLVGDVLLYGDTELWLAGAIELDEEGLVARLFPTPGALRSEWLAQLDEEARDLATMSLCDEVPAGAVPESLPIGGRRLTLERRGHAEVRCEGESLPRTQTRGRYSLLSDAGGRVLFVLDFDKAPRLALSGDRVARHMMDLLPGGDD